MTVAKYKTPSGTEILDHKGLRPDNSCQPGRQLSAVRQMMASNKPKEAPALNSVTTSFSPGLPIGPVMEAALKAQLKVDACVLAAEEVMDHSHASPLLMTAALHQSKI